MKKIYAHTGLLLLATLGVAGANMPSAAAAAANAAPNLQRRSYGTVTGLVRDSAGAPLAGALVSLLREGAGQVAREVRSAADGTFTARVAPGRYDLRAAADGFNTASFSAVDVRASEELVYRFNLEPAGRGRTSPERRADRDDPKFKIRSAHRRRSIFNANERAGDVVEVAAGEAENVSLGEESAETAAGESLPGIDAGRAFSRRAHGVVEIFQGLSAGPDARAATGVNFAVSQPFAENFDLILAGQTGPLDRFEATARLRLNGRHRVSTTLGGARLSLRPAAAKILGGDGALEQLSARAVDEWVVRDGVVVVIGFDYSRFLGAGGGSDSFTPRVGFQFDAGARTRLRAAYAPGADAGTRVESVSLGEDVPILFKELTGQDVAVVDGRAVLARTNRLEFGVERVLSNSSSVEATAFFDTVDGRGVGLLSAPLGASATENGAALLDAANQQGGAKGLRVVYTRRLGHRLKASAAYAFGRGQQLSPDAFADPESLFEDAAFQTAAAQVDADVRDGMSVRTVLRFSPRASVFAIDPFAGRLAVYDPSLSVLVTQELPNFGLPVRAEAVLDARNLLDAMSGLEDGESSLSVNQLRRTVRGGISVRF
jgi:hypothetical protein